MTINLTQHAATAEQAAAGVIDLPADVRAKVSYLLTFNTPPESKDMRRRAAALGDIALQAGARSAMIGGAPFFMSALESALKMRGIYPVYAFSRRESVEEKLPDGSVRKVAVFRHNGFVAALNGSRRVLRFSSRPVRGLMEDAR